MLSSPVMRYGIAAVSGAVIYGATLYRFLSYTERNRLGGGSYLSFAALAFIAGFGLTLGVRQTRYRIVHWLLAGVFAAHAAVIAIDVREDPTNHNLLPFEFVMLAIVASPGYIGAALARWADSSKGPPPLPEG